MSYRTSIVSHRSVDWNATPTEQLPRLPGEVGAATATLSPTIEYPPKNVAEQVDVFTRQARDELTTTEVFERVVFHDEPFKGWTKKDLLWKARKLQIRGRSKMNKAQLIEALIALD